MVQTPKEDQDRLIDQSLSLLRNAIAETKTVLPAVEFRHVEMPKDVVPETPFQRQQADSLIDQTLSLLRNAIAETETVLPAAEFRGAEKPKDVVLETPFQQDQRDSLIDQTLSLIENVAALEPEEPEPLSGIQRTAENTSADVLPEEPREQNPSDQPLSLVEEPEPPSSIQPAAKQTSTDVLPAEPREQNPPDQPLSLVENAAAFGPEEPEPPSSIQPTAKQTSTDALSPAEPFVQHDQTASLIDQTFMVEQSLQQLVAEQISKKVSSPATPIQEERTASPINQTLSMVAVAVSGFTVTETSPPILRQSVAKQTFKDVIPTEPPVQGERTAPVIARALSMAKSVAAAGAKLAPKQSVAKKTSKDVAPTESPVQDEREASVIGQAQFLVGDLAIGQQEQTASLIDQTPSLVAIVAVAKPKEPREMRSPMQQDAAKQTSTHVQLIEPPVREKPTASFAERAMSLEGYVVVPEPMMNDALSRSVEPEDSPTELPVRDASLVDETLPLSFVRNVTDPAGPTPTEGALPSSQEPPAKQLTPKEQLDLERAEIQKRVATFKANQQRFQHEREEYYAAIMAKVHSTQQAQPKEFRHELFLTGGQRSFRSGMISIGPSWRCKCHMDFIGLIVSNAPVRHHVLHQGQLGSSRVHEFVSLLL